ncbi:response regulator transcription factor [Paenibacillus athensensis]|nr:response regulator transcription factor [Paenibacillus athensensis]
MIKVLLVDDEEFWRNALTEYLQAEPDLVVIGAVATKEEALQIVQLIDIDVAIVDVMLTAYQHDGLEAAGDMIRLKPATKVIVLTSMSEGDIIIDTFALGAVNFIEKTAYKDLPEAVRAAYQNRTSIHASGAEVLLLEFLRLKQKEQAGMLTPTEKEILQRIYQGQTQEQIQRQLNVSRSTIKNHVTNILKKLGVRNSKEAAVLAAKRKWL